jgi:hypothetical protein
MHMTTTNLRAGGIERNPFRRFNGVAGEATADVSRMAGDSDSGNEVGIQRRRPPLLCRQMQQELGPLRHLNDWGLR